LTFRKYKVRLDKKYRNSFGGNKMALMTAIVTLSNGAEVLISADRSHPEYPPGVSIGACKMLNAKEFDVDGPVGAIFSEDGPIEETNVYGTMVPDVPRLVEVLNVWRGLKRLEDKLGDAVVHPDSDHNLEKQHE
jgi:hypothetical protein